MTECRGFVVTQAVKALGAKIGRPEINGNLTILKRAGEIIDDLYDRLDRAAALVSTYCPGPDTESDTVLLVKLRADLFEVTDLDATTDNPTAPLHVRPKKGE